MTTVLFGAQEAHPWLAESWILYGIRIPQHLLEEVFITEDEVKLLLKKEPFALRLECWVIDSSREMSKGRDGRWVARPFLHECQWYETEAEIQVDFNGTGLSVVGGQPWPIHYWPREQMRLELSFYSLSWTGKKKWVIRWQER